MVANADVAKINLTSDYRHDRAVTSDAAKTAGLVYICNPNNPTASITPKNEIVEFISKLPRETVVLVDEAYHHYVESNIYESVIPLVKDNPNLIVEQLFEDLRHGRLTLWLLCDSAGEYFADEQASDL